MAIAAYFHPKNMTLAQFNEIHRRRKRPARNQIPTACTTPVSGTMAT